MNVKYLPVIIIAFGFPLLTQAECQVPKNLNGLTFINAVDPLYSPQNPNADTLLKLVFTQDKYTSHFLKTDTEVFGNYTYRMLAPQVGLMEAKEQFGQQLTQFRLTLVCLNNHSGTFVFNQEHGAIKPDIRQNTGTYTIL
jgi:hypothetical protein